MRKTKRTRATHRAMPRVLRPRDSSALLFDACGAFCATMKTLRLLVLLVLGFAWPVAAAEDAYEIRLERPVKVGDRFKVAAKVTVDSSTKTIAKGEDPAEETIRASCKLLAEYTVVAV